MQKQILIKNYVMTVYLQKIGTYCLIIKYNIKYCSIALHWTTSKLLVHLYYYKIYLAPKIHYSTNCKCVLTYYCRFLNLIGCITLWPSWDWQNSPGSCCSSSYCLHIYKGIWLGTCSEIYRRGS